MSSFIAQPFSVFKATFDDSDRVLIFAGCYTLDELEDKYDNWLDFGTSSSPEFAEIARRGFEFAHFEELQTGGHAECRCDMIFAENYWRNHFGLCSQINKHDFRFSHEMMCARH